MRRLATVLTIAAVVVLSSTGAAARQLSVSPTADARNLRVEPAPGGGVVITYDLVAGDPRAIVSAVLEASRTAGGAFDVTPRTTRGDVGPGLRPGPGKRIVWEAGKDIEDLQPDRLRFHITISATVANTPPADPRMPTSRGTLTIGTSPESAMISLDGRPLGVSPLEIRGISAGEHRITATKTGFSKQSRIVTVEAGSSARVDIPMTATDATSVAGARKSGNAKWLAIAGGAAAAVAAAALAGSGATAATPPATTTATPTTTTPTTTTTPAPNRAPTVTCGNVVFGGARTLVATDVGVASATRYQFSIAAASDVDGDSLSFTITYGNGVTSTATYSATSNSSTYVYPGAGTYSPSVTVRDARSGEAGCRYPTVLTSTIAAEWIGNATTGANSSRLVLTQSGVNVGGNYYEDGRTAANAVQGTLSSNVSGRKDGGMTLTVGGSFANLLQFSLEPSDDLKSFKGTYTYRGRSGAFEMRRTQ